MFVLYQLSYIREMGCGCEGVKVWVCWGNPKWLPTLRLTVNVGANIKAKTSDTQAFLGNFFLFFARAFKAIGYQATTTFIFAANLSFDKLPVLLNQIAG